MSAAVDLLDDGSTVPFIARYRKEATGALDDAQLRTLEERLRYLRELEDRRTAVLEEIRKQGKLTPELEERIRAAESKARLEDIYLPFKPKRRTKAMIAREAGLEPLADTLLADPTQDPATVAAGYVNEQVADVAAALEGARAILVERFAEDADLIGGLRERMWTRGRLVTKVRGGKESDGAPSSPTTSTSPRPSPRCRRTGSWPRSAARRRTCSTSPWSRTPSRPSPGWSPTTSAPSPPRSASPTAAARPTAGWPTSVRWAWRTRILLHLGIDIRVRLRTVAEEGAIGVFATNLRDLLLAAPAGSRATMGLDPGLRTGVKVAVVDATGKVVATDTIYPHEPRRAWDAALATLTKLAVAHDVELVAIGNGTASRETDKLARELAARNPALKLTTVMVSEAGASVYSASAYASAELPALDVSLRGAVSIARRLQDPLAELVKIDPKSIGVGQYQHDLAESALSRSLDAVVEDCVNAVGVDVNTASVPLLRRVSGITEGLATQIVAHRDANGPFRTRTALAGVPRLGPKAFEQCAGFLRIRGGDDPLDVSGVHPESYPVVHRILAAAKTDIATLIGNGPKLKSLRPKDFVDDRFGLPTVTDILTELEKPGRDPRPVFRTATFAEGVHTISDLRPGMLLEGVVTNVAAFGAFVDVGVHQDGLVHVSAMSVVVRLRPARGGQVRRRGAGQGAGGRRGAQAHLADPAAGRRAGRRAQARGGGPAERGGRPAERGRPAGRERRGGRGPAGDRLAAARAAGDRRPAARAAGGRAAGDRGAARPGRPARRAAADDRRGGIGRVPAPGSATAPWPTRCAGPASPATATRTASADHAQSPADRRTVEGWRSGRAGPGSRSPGETGSI